MLRIIKQAISSNQQIIQTLGQQKHELEEKLRKLREFNQNHQKYLKKLKNFKNCPTRTYTSTKFLELFNKSINIPSGKELDWAKVSHEKYLKVAMGKIEHKAEKKL